MKTIINIPSESSNPSAHSNPASDRVSSGQDAVLQSSGLGPSLDPSLDRKMKPKNNVDWEKENFKDMNKFLKDILMKNYGRMTLSSMDNYIVPLSLCVSSSGYIQILIALQELASKGTERSIKQHIKSSIGVRFPLELYEFILEKLEANSGDFKNFIKVYHKCESVFVKNERLEKELKTLLQLKQKADLFGTVDFVCDNKGDYDKWLIDQEFSQNLGIKEAIPFSESIKPSCRLILTNGIVGNLNFEMGEVTKVQLEVKGGYPDASTYTMDAWSCHAEFSYAVSTDAEIVRLEGKTDKNLEAIIVQPFDWSDFISKQIDFEKYWEISENTPKKELNLILPIFENSHPLNIRQIVTRSKRRKLSNLFRRLPDPLARCFSTNKAEFTKIVNTMSSFGMENAFPLYDVFMTTNLNYFAVERTGMEERVFEIREKIKGNEEGGREAERKGNEVGGRETEKKEEVKLMDPKLKMIKENKESDRHCNSAPEKRRSQTRKVEGISFVESRTQSTRSRRSHGPTPHSTPNRLNPSSTPNPTPRKNAGQEPSIPSLPTPNLPQTTLDTVMINAPFLYLIRYKLGENNALPIAMSINTLFQ